MGTHTVLCRRIGCGGSDINDSSPLSYENLA
jgi:hypothetical protein